MFHVPSGSDLLVILLIIIVLFGAKRIPEIMKGLGQGMKEFKNATREASEEFRKATEPEPPPAAPAPVVPPPLETSALPPPPTEAAPAATPLSEEKPA